MNMGKANKAIRNAWIAGVITGAWTLILGLVGALGFDLWNLLDAFIILGLTFGIYKKNRVCAVILFIYWVVDSILLVGGALVEPGGLIIALAIRIAFGYFFFQGIRGTFAYHRIAKTEENVDAHNSG